ncbi:hypothetical protein K2173_016376 [Erythroxylum novogranatense]|uniref:Uncharacterized protein n=1 Tax=Erythroxylum novogranatense TaxID=1862640 RepID=A0AAV8SG78_9ROSI|nr:hypothetical protein K2173_016376 [Erythroxylum novogranatense]
MDVPKEIFLKDYKLPDYYFDMSAIVQVDAAPFKQWYLQHYGVDIDRKKKTTAPTKKEEEVGNCLDPAPKRHRQ